MTITAVEPQPGPCLDANQAVIYRGPWRRVEDDDGHIFARGERAAVCAKTYDALTHGPYATHVVGIAPRVPVPPHEREPFDCARTAPRHPRETKREAYRETLGSGACAPGSGCCE